ncbi:MAG: hypothetical protein WAT92_14515 [Saprospiraceae bacterium]
MKALNINCNHCGNLLEVNQNSKYVTCNNCGTLLEIVKNETSYFSIEKEGETSHQMTNQVEQNQEKFNAQIYTEIEMLDRKWNNLLPNFMVRGTLPDTEGHLPTILGIFGIVIGIAFVIGSGPLILPGIIFGALFVIGGSWNILNHLNRRAHFLNTKKSYERRRNELLLKIKK